MKRIILVLLLLLSASCAKRGLPTGGPEDKTPPTLTLSLPENGETNIPVDARFTLTFSEPVKPTSAERAIFLSPPSGKLTTICRGKQVSITHPPIDKGKTYSLIITDRLADMHGNHLQGNIIITFSTGKTIDTIDVHGRVLAPGRYSILAYRGGKSDIFNRLPDYFSITDTTGSFKMCGLPDRDFVFIALEDKNSNLRLDNGEKVGFFDGEKRCPLNFAPTEPDTTPPKITKAFLYTKKTVALVFSEPVLTGEGFTLKDAYQRLSLDTLFVPIDSIPDHIPPLEGIFDLAGNTLAAETVLVWKETVIEDSIPAFVVAVIPEPKKRITVPDTSFTIIFSKPTETPDISILCDSTNRIKGTVKRISSNRFLFKANSPLPTLSTCKLLVADTSFSFKTAEFNQYGGVLFSSNLTPPYIIVFEGNDTFASCVEHHPKKLHLPGGEYSISAFIDRNGNGRFDKGSFSLPADTPYISDEPITIRPRWTTEDVEFIFK
ncbi:Ig-like domain-containing protein [bacterium]|nr:Ig-like domain-containing protein [bacterium]